MEKNHFEKTLRRFCETAKIRMTWCEQRDGEEEEEDCRKRGNNKKCQETEGGRH